MSFIPEIKGVGENKWIGNGLRFATAGEAINYAIELQGRWMGCKAGPKNRRATESDDPVTHSWTRNGLVAKETTP